MRAAAFAIFLALAGLLLLVMPSCASQGEGERCDVNSGTMGTDDCNAGLVCTSPDQLRWPVTTDGGIAQRPSTYICCPPPVSQGGAPATTDVCKNMVPSVGSDAAIMDDGETPETSSSDAPVETSSDAPVDSPADTSGDAPSDATGD